MTAQVSTSNAKSKSFVKSYLRFRFEKNSTVNVLYALFNLLSYPLIFATMLITLGVNGGDFSDDFSTSLAMGTNAIGIFMGGIWICIAALCCVVIFSLLIAIRNFKYMIDKNLVDMSYSLPIKRKERFFSDYLLGLCEVSIPYIISSVIGIILLTIANALYGVSELTDFFNTNIIGMGAQLMLVGLLALIGLYSFTVLAVCLAKNTGGVISNIYLMLFVIPLIITLLVCTSFSGHSYGIDITEFLVPILAAINPCIYVAGSFLNIANVGVTEMFDFSVFDPLVTAVYIIVIALCVLVSYALSTRRRAESIGSKQAFPIVYNVSVILCIFAIIAVAWTMTSYDNVANIPAVVFVTLIITAVFTLVVEAVSKKNLKGIGFCALRYVLTVIGSLLIMFGASNMNGFGIENYAPSADDISYVESNIMVNADSRVTAMYSSERDMLYSYRDPEAIALFTNLQRECLLANESGIEAVAKEYSMNGIDGENSYISEDRIIFHLKSGGTVKREYYVYSFQYRKLLPIIGSEGYGESFVRRLESNIEGCDYTVTVSDIAQLDVVTPEKTVGAEIVEALKKDICARTNEQYLRGENSPIALVELNYDGERRHFNINLPVFDYDANTVAALNKAGITGFGDLSKKLRNVSASIFVEERPLFGDTMLDTYSLNILLGNGDERVKTLLEHLKPIGDSAGTVYGINIGLRYYIPEKYSALAEEVFNELAERAQGFQTEVGGAWLSEGSDELLNRTGVGYTTEAISSESYYYIPEWATYEAEARTSMTALFDKLHPLSDNITLCMNGSYSNDGYNVAECYRIELLEYYHPIPDEHNEIILNIYKIVGKDKFSVLFIDSADYMNGLSDRYSWSMRPADMSYNIREMTEDEIVEYIETNIE